LAGGRKKKAKPKEGSSEIKKWRGLGEMRLKKGQKVQKKITRTKKIGGKGGI